MHVTWYILRLLNKTIVLWRNIYRIEAKEALMNKLICCPWNTHLLCLGYHIGRNKLYFLGCECVLKNPIIEVLRFIENMYLQVCWQICSNKHSVLHNFIFYSKYNTFNTIIILGNSYVNQRVVLYRRWCRSLSAKDP